MEPVRSNRATGPGRPKRAALYARLDEAGVEPRDRWGGLPSPEQSHAIWDDIRVHEAHNSTALEGNTLALREVGQLLRDGRAVGSKQLADHLEVQG